MAGTGRAIAGPRSAIVLVLVLLTLIGAGAALAFERDQSRDEARHAADRAALATDDRIGLMLRTLSGARAVVDPAHPLRIDTAAFTAYASAALEDDALAGLSWDARVRPAERMAFERAIGPIQGMTPGDPGPARGSHYPVTVAVTRDEPIPSARTAGIDHASEHERLAAIQAAIASGEPRATPVIELASGSRGFVVFQPVYRTPRPPLTVAERRRAAVGVMAGAFATGQLTRRLAGTSDVAITENGALVAGTPPTRTTESSGLSVAGRPWTVSVPVGRPDLTLPLGVLIAGLLLTGAVAILLWTAVRQERRLAESEGRFRAMADTAPVLILMLDREGRCTYVNREWERVTGRSAAEELGDGWHESLEGGDAEALRRRVRTRRRDAGPFDHEVTMRHLDGTPRLMLVRLRPAAAEGEEAEWIGTLVDMTAQRAAETARQAAAIERALAREHDGLRRIAVAVARGESPEQIFSMVADEACEALAANEVMLLRDLGEGVSEVVAVAEVREHRHARGQRWILDRSEGSDVRAPIAVGNAQWGWIIAFGCPAPVTAEGRLQRFAELVTVAIMNVETRRQLAEMAATDPLTGLANRRSFDAALLNEVRRAQRHGRELSMVIFDIDHFKAVNDTYGHQVGDAVLREVAGALAGAVREGEMVARIGGEEFAWLLPDAGLGPAVRAAERARAAVAERLIPPVGAVTVSAGVATLGDAAEPDELIARADRALYAAKEAGRDVTVADGVAPRVPSGELVVPG